jgi:hypothetical protein
MCVPIKQGRQKPPAFHFVCIEYLLVSYLWRKSLLLSHDLTDDLTPHFAVSMRKVKYNDNRLPEMQQTT